MLDRIAADNTFITHDVFDEATFHVTGGCHYLRNVHIWGSETQHTLREHMHDSPKVNVWCSLVINHIVGPFFFQEPTVDGAIYLDMLKQFAVPDNRPTSKRGVSTERCTTPLEPWCPKIYKWQIPTTMDWPSRSNSLAAMLAQHNPPRFFLVGLYERPSIRYTSKGPARLETVHKNCHQLWQNGYSTTNGVKSIIDLIFFALPVEPMFMCTESSTCVLKLYELLYDFPVYVRQ